MKQSVETIWTGRLLPMRIFGPYIPFTVRRVRDIIFSHIQCYLKTPLGIRYRENIYQSRR